MIYANRAFCEMTGKNRGEMIGHHLGIGQKNQRRLERQDQHPADVHRHAYRTDAGDDRGRRYGCCRIRILPRPHAAGLRTDSRSPADRSS
ncbi:PAS domain-containing protein [Desulfoplanes sp.]